MPFKVTLLGILDDSGYRGATSSTGSSSASNFGSRTSVVEQSMKHASMRTSVLADKRQSACARYGVGKYEIVYTLNLNKHY